MTDANDLVYLRARYYAPALGVFTGLDPVENLNRYQYVGSNPTNYIDPRGLIQSQPGYGNCPPGYQDAVPEKCMGAVNATEVGCCCKPDPWHGCDAFGTYYVATDAWKEYWENKDTVSGSSHNTGEYTASGAVIVALGAFAQTASLDGPQPGPFDVIGLGLFAATLVGIAAGKTAEPDFRKRPPAPPIYPLRDLPIKELSEQCGEALEKLIREIARIDIKIREGDGGDNDCLKGKTPQQAAQDYSDLAIGYRDFAAGNESYVPIVVTYTEVKLQGHNNCLPVIAINNRINNVDGDRPGKWRRAKTRLALDDPTPLSVPATERGFTDLNIDTAQHAERNMVMALRGRVQCNSFKAMGISQSPCPTCRSWLQNPANVPFDLVWYPR